MVFGQVQEQHGRMDALEHDTYLIVVFLEQEQPPLRTKTNEEGLLLKEISNYYILLQRRQPAWRRDMAPRRLKLMKRSGIHRIIHV